MDFKQIETVMDVEADAQPFANRTSVVIDSVVYDYESIEATCKVYKTMQ